MQQEHQILQQINTAKQAVEASAANNTHKHEQQTTIEAQIHSLEQQIASIVLAHPPSHQHIQHEIQELTDLINSLNNDLLNQAAAIQTADTNSQAQISQLQLQHNALASSNKQGIVLDSKQLDSISTQTEELKGKAHSETVSLEKIKHELLENDQKLRNMQDQIEQIKIFQHQENQGIQTVQQGNAQLESLLREYQHLEKQYENINHELNLEKQKKQSSKGQLKASIQTEANQLVQLKKIHDAEVQVAKSLHSQLADQEKITQQRKAEKDHAISLLEKQTASKEHEVESLRKGNNLKREEVKREEERIAEEQKKMQKAKNYKDLIKQAFAENEGLQKMRDNQLNIYNKTLQNKSTYATRQTLDILQRELGRHQNQKSVSIDGITKELERAQKTNKHLKDRIKNLTRLSQQSLAKEQKHLNDQNKKRDGLLVEKLETDKLIIQRTNKLNEYTKHFPNYEQEKEQKRRLKIKKTESITTEQPSEPQLPQKSPRKQKGKKANKEEEELHELQLLLNESQGSKMFKETKWYKRRTSLDYEAVDDKPIYMNHSFQAAGVLLVLLVATISYLD